MLFFPCKKSHYKKKKFYHKKSHLNEWQFCIANYWFKTVKMANTMNTQHQHEAKKKKLKYFHVYKIINIICCILK